MTIAEELITIYDADLEGSRIDESPFSTSTTDNWVARLGGLPGYIRGVCRGIMRSGHSFEDALPIAIGVMRTWAAGGPTFGHKSHATPATIAKAQSALAQWEAMKAASHRSIELSVRSTPGPSGQPVPSGQLQTAGGVNAAVGAYSVGHPFHGNQHTGPIVQPHQQKKQQPKGHAKASASASKTASATASATAKATAAGQTPAPGAVNAETPVHFISPPGAPKKTSSGGTGGGGKGGGGKGGGGTGAGRTPTAGSSQAQLVAAVGTAQTAYTQARDRATSAAHSLAQTQAQATQNISFAQAKQANTMSAATNLAEKNALAAVTLAAAGTIQQATDAHNTAQDALNAATKNLELAMKAAGYRHDPENLEFRDFVGEGGTSGASYFLPAGVSPMQAKKVMTTEVMGPHRFVGNDLEHCSKCRKPITHPSHRVPNSTPTSKMATLPKSPIIRSSAGGTGWLPGWHWYQGANLMKCEVCGKPITDPTHRLKEGRGDGALKAKIDEAGPPIQPIPPVPRQAPGLTRAATQALTEGDDGSEALRTAYAAHKRNVALVEAPLTSAIQAHFAEQRRATLNRLLGKRGGRMLKRAFAELTPESIEAELAVPELAAAVEPVAEVFDSGFWADKLKNVIEPHLGTAAALAGGAVRSQISVPGGDDTRSTTEVGSAMSRRAAAAAQTITNTTAKQIAGAVQAGVARGETRDEIGSRVNEVFDEAQRVRSEQIARTSAWGGYNESLLTYAQHLPDGIVGSKTWAASDEDTTRPDHRAANGQQQPLDQPFTVGGAAVQYPGDPSAPQSEWVNEGCSIVLSP